MCLGIPGEVMELHEREGLRFARVRFGGITREVCLEFLPDVAPGDYVLVHVGFALSRIDAEQAEENLRILAELGEREGP
jgi:hydrogenase expression/formation protein HypC